MVTFPGARSSVSSGAPRSNPFVVSLGLGLGLCVQPTEEAVVSAPTTWTLPGAQGRPFCSFQHVL